MYACVFTLIQNKIKRFTQLVKPSRFRYRFPYFDEFMANLSFELPRKKTLNRK